MLSDYEPQQSLGRGSSARKTGLFPTVTCYWPFREVTSVVFVS